VSTVNEDLTYEQALELLDRRLKALEDGDLSLDDALSVVDEARGYLRVCERRLEEARRRIEVRPEGAGAGPGPESAEGAR
jgi:exodeoxyribonuclease VII small subunit